MLQHLLREGSIVLGLTASSREEALKQLIEKIPGEALVDQDRKFLFELLLQRENFGTTAIGDGVAMPHCAFSGVSFPVGVLGISPEGIDWQSIDGARVHVIFLCIFPDVDGLSELKRRVLAPAESILKDVLFQSRLGGAESGQEVYDMILRESSDRLPALRVAQ
ncbi:MAG: PTS sugar transporter subunit IIA [Candidatus Omnitrophota bacterium]|jgi:mannitol/fructose-specific phosphotransferase system IIA component (Ntr-type)